MTIAPERVREIFTGSRRIVGRRRECIRDAVAFSARIGRRVRAMIHLKRVYEEPSKKDGMRVLVERLWPRGLTKERAAVDLWLKDVAPSPELQVVRP